MSLQYRQSNYKVYSKFSEIKQSFTLVLEAEIGSQKWLVPMR